MDFLQHSLFMAHDSCRSSKIKIPIFKKIQIFKKSSSTNNNTCFSTIYTLRSVNNRKQTASFQHMSREMPQMVKKQQMRSRQTWCKQTILVFFVQSFVLSGPKKNSILTPEAIKKIELVHAHSCRRDIASLLNVPKQRAITVSLSYLTWFIQTRDTVLVPK